MRLFNDVNEVVDLNKSIEDEEDHAGVDVDCMNRAHHACVADEYEQEFESDQLTIQSKFLAQERLDRGADVDQDVIYLADKAGHGR